MEKLVLERKVEDLLNRDLYPMLKKFPKAEKFSLCQEIKTCCYEMLRFTLLANGVKSKRRTYQEHIDANQKLLLVLLSVACEQKYITRKKLEYLQGKLFEIGRILGGWMKSG